MGAVSASEVNIDNSTELGISDDVEDIISNNEVNEVISVNDDGNGSGNDTPVEIKKASFGKISKKTNYLTKETFDVKLLDDKGKKLANKTVYFKVKNKNTKIVTDSKGIAKLPLKYAKGKYTITYTFNETGYKTIKGSKKIFLLTKPKSTIKASSFKGYAGLRQVFTVTLKGDEMNLSGRKVKFMVDKKVYFVKTNSKGQASIAIYLPKGIHHVKYFYYGEENIKSCKGSNKLSYTYIKNPYKTKLRTVVIDADGGFTRAFLNDVANKLRIAGWKVILKGIGPEQHSLNYYKVRNAVYFPFYNGMCAATIKEMGYNYYGGLIKKHNSVLATAFYTKQWTNPQGMLPYRYDITKLAFLKRAWDDNFSPKSFKGLAYPAEYMTSHDVKYCVGDSSYMIVEQFLYGGWVAHHTAKGLI